MSDTENTVPRPLGWSIHGRSIHHHTISALSIQVTKTTGGDRYFEVIDDDRIVFGKRLTATVAFDLARLLTD